MYSLVASVQVRLQPARPNAAWKKFAASWEPVFAPVIIAMSPPRPPLPSKRLVIRSRKASARSARRPFSYSSN